MPVNPWLTRRARVNLLNSLKVTAGCMDCGYNADPLALDFDHVRGKKLYSVSKMIQRRWAVMWAEIAKCEVVCANCHRIRTWRTRGRL